MLPKIFATGIREYKATALTKAFIFGTFVLPVVFYGVLIALFAANVFEAEEKAVQGTIAVIDETDGDVVIEGVRERFDSERIQSDRAERREQELEKLREAQGPAYNAQAAEMAVDAMLGPIPDVTIESLPDQADMEAQQQRIRAGELIAVARVPADVLEIESGNGDAPRIYDLFLAPTVQRQIRSKIENSIEDAVVDERFERAGLDRQRITGLVRSPRANSVTVTETGETEQGDVAEVIIPLAAIFLLAMAIFTGSGYLLMSLVEEKSSRVMEVLLSGISPAELMTGKIFGQCLVGATVLLIYGGLSVAAARQFGVFELIDPASLILLGAYFVIGYIMYAAIFAAIGAAVTEVREAQALQAPVFGVAFLLIYIGVFAAINDASSMLARVLSYVPPSLPFVMSMRVTNPTEQPPMWEVAATLAIGVASVIFLIWAAAKIFRVGVLMYGKAPTPMTLVKWIRYA